MLIFKHPTFLAFTPITTIFWREKNKITIGSLYWFRIFSFHSRQFVRIHRQWRYRFFNTVHIDYVALLGYSRESRKNIGIQANDLLHIFFLFLFLLSSMRIDCKTHPSPSIHHFNIYAYICACKRFIPVVFMFQSRLNSIRKLWIVHLFNNYKCIYLVWFVF